MDTSKTIKSRQYSPIEPIWTSEDGFEMKFRSERHHSTIYHTRRNREEQDLFACNCPALGLCKHITAMVLSFAAPRYEKASVWTKETDPGRQHRADVTLQANGREFWVTYGRRRAAVDNPDVCMVSLDGRGVCEVVFADGERREAPGLWREVKAAGWKYFAGAWQNPTPPPYSAGQRANLERWEARVAAR